MAYRFLQMIVSLFSSTSQILYLLFLYLCYLLTMPPFFLPRFFCQTFLFIFASTHSNHFTVFFLDGGIESPKDVSNQESGHSKLAKTKSIKDEDSNADKAKSILQAKLTKLAIQISYAGNRCIPLFCSSFYTLFNGLTRHALHCMKRSKLNHGIEYPFYVIFSIFH